MPPGPLQPAWGLLGWCCGGALLLQPAWGFLKWCCGGALPLQPAWGSFQAVFAAVPSFLWSRTSTLCIRNGGGSRDSNCYPTTSTANAGACSVSLVLVAGGRSCLLLQLMAAWSCACARELKSCWRTPAGTFGVCGRLAASHHPS